jgi:hypothetical protein
MTVRPVIRTDARAEFLRDVITGAIEGGIGYWSQCSQYQWLDGDTVNVVVGERDGDEARAVIHVLNDDESGYVEQGLTLDIEAVERGLKLIREGGCGIHTRTRNRLLVADRGNDAGDLDALDCDLVVQAGLLGEIVYA